MLHFNFNHRSGVNSEKSKQAKEIHPEKLESYSAIKHDDATLVKYAIALSRSEDFLNMGEEFIGLLDQSRLNNDSNPEFQSFNHGAPGVGTIPKDLQKWVGSGFLLKEIVQSNPETCTRSGKYFHSGLVSRLIKLGDFGERLLDLILKVGVHSKQPIELKSNNQETNTKNLMNIFRYSQDRVSRPEKEILTRVYLIAKKSKAEFISNKGFSTDYLSQGFDDFEVPKKKERTTDSKIFESQHFKDLKNLKIKNIGYALSFASSESLERLSNVFLENEIFFSTNLESGVSSFRDYKSDGGKLADIVFFLKDYIDGEKINFPKLSKVLGKDLEVFIEILNENKNPPTDIANYAFFADFCKSLNRNFEQKGLNHKKENFHVFKNLLDLVLRNEFLIDVSNPILDQAALEIPAHAFKGQGLISVQHTFPTLVHLVEKCIEKGMSPKDIYINGTPYTYNPLVYEYLKVMGVTMVKPHEINKENKSTVAFELNKKRSVSKLLSLAVASNPEKGWKLLDDGGTLNEMFLESNLKNNENSKEELRVLRQIQNCGIISAVEQTTRGLIKLENDLDNLPFTFVDCSQEKGKNLEGEKVIGFTVADSIVRQINWRSGQDKIKTITLIGYGTVGSAVADNLKAKGFQVKIVDISDDARKQAKAKGFEVFSKVSAGLKNSDAVVEATGRSVVTNEDLIDFDGLCFSASSSTIAFNADTLKAYGLDKNLMNGGMPVNFMLYGHEIPKVHQIGITPTLLFLGLAQDSLVKDFDQLGKTKLGLERKSADKVVENWIKFKGDQLKYVPDNQPKIPDLKGKARHDEWMTFFRNTQFPVSPHPSTTNYKEGIYSFSMPDKSIRIVDTRFQSCSIDLGIKGIPLDFHFMANAFDNELYDNDFTDKNGNKDFDTMRNWYSFRYESFESGKVESLQFESRVKYARTEKLPPMKKLDYFDQEMKDVFNHELVKKQGAFYKQRFQTKYLFKKEFTEDNKEFFQFDIASFPVKNSPVKNSQSIKRGNLTYDREPTLSSTKIEKKELQISKATPAIFLSSGGVILFPKEKIPVRIKNNAVGVFTETYNLFPKKVKNVECIIWDHIFSGHLAFVTLDNGRKGLLFMDQYSISSEYGLIELPEGVEGFRECFLDSQKKESHLELYFSMKDKSLSSKDLLKMKVLPGYFQKNEGSNGLAEKFNITPFKTLMGDQKIPTIGEMKNKSP